jgi:hypothetical protein
MAFEPRQVSVIEGAAITVIIVAQQWSPERSDPH